MGTTDGYHHVPLPDPWVPPLVTAASSKHPGATGSAEELQPQCPIGSRSWGIGGNLPHRQLPTRLDAMAPRRQRGIAGFGCPGWIFPLSWMNHLLKIFQVKPWPDLSLLWKQKYLFYSGHAWVLAELYDPFLRNVPCSAFKLQLPLAPRVRLKRLG